MDVVVVFVLSSLLDHRNECDIVPSCKNVPLCKNVHPCDNVPNCNA